MARRISKKHKGKKKSLHDVAMQSRIHDDPAETKSSLRRDKTVFDGSRLYRQAKEGSLQLYEELKGTKMFAHPVHALNKDKSSLRVSNINELNDLIPKAENHLDMVCSSLSPYLAIPILMQMTTEFYFGQYERQPSWLGSALKLAIAKTWKNVHCPPIQENKSLSQLSKAVSSAGLVQQLYSHKEIFQTCGEGIFVLHESGFNYSPELARFARYFYVSFQKRGASMRVLDQIDPILLKQPKASFEAIHRILDGHNVADEPIFEGTLFADIPRENHRFWIQLFLLLALVAITTRISLEVTSDTISIAIFERMGLTVPGVDARLYNTVRPYLFWTKDWYDNQQSSWMSNMLVERPILRLQENKEIFCSSPLLIRDTINWFIEATVMSYTVHGGVSLSKKYASPIFRKYISEPFEECVKSLLKRFGFVAGRVTDNGSWLVNGAVEVLAHKNKTKLPGEIDVLAFHAESMGVFVIECKVLGLPYSFERMRNQIIKLGLDDGEAFHAKLRKKLEWVQQTSRFSFLPEQSFVGLIVLDRKAPAMFLPSEFHVMDFDVLKDFLGSALAQPPKSD